MQGNPATVFFENAQFNAVVTGTHARFGSAMYPLAGITGVIHQHVPAQRAWALLALLLGIACALFGINQGESGAIFTWIGVMVGLCGLAILVVLKDRWIVRIDMASGHSFTFVAFDQNMAAQLALALRAAIDARG